LLFDKKDHEIIGENQNVGYLTNNLPRVCDVTRLMFPSQLISWKDYWVVKATEAAAIYLNGLENYNTLNISPGFEIFKELVKIPGILNDAGYSYDPNSAFSIGSRLEENQQDLIQKLLSSIDFQHINTETFRKIHQAWTAQRVAFEDRVGYLRDHNTNKSA